MARFIQVHRRTGGQQVWINSAVIAAVKPPELGGGSAPATILLTTNAPRGLDQSFEAQESAQEVADQLSR